MYLAETNGRYGGDCLVQRIEDAEPEDDVPERASADHDPKGEQREADPSKCPHESDYPFLPESSLGLLGCKQGPTPAAH